MPVMKQKVLKILSLTLALVFSSGTVLGQCAMCQATAENSIAEGSTQALGLNFGVMYLLLLPFMAVSLLGFLWFLHHQKQKTFQ